MVGNCFAACRANLIHDFLCSTGVSAGAFDVSAEVIDHHEGATFCQKKGVLPS
jgi:hypothetical protein